MTLPIYRLRRWLAAIAVLFTLVVAGMYLYARLRQHDVTKSVGKIPYEIRQTAKGFQLSKSDGGRTLFTVQASNLKQFKLDGRAELHNVSIVLYGRDSSRFDQIYGDDFTFDQKSGDVIANGEVQIDLEPNPSGATGPDQATPKELKNPIHLKTRDLVFNNKTGNASTDARVDFRTPQATGSAVGVRYTGKTNTLTLVSQVHVVLIGEQGSVIDAAHGTFISESHQVELEHAQLRQGNLRLQTDQATLFLAKDNSVERVLAIGNIKAETTTNAGVEKSAGSQSDSTASEKTTAMHARADRGELLLEGKQNRLRTATLAGNVEVERIGSQPLEAHAGQAVLDFVGQNELQKVHALDGVHLAQRAANTTQSTVSASKPQDFDLIAPAIDFFVTTGRVLDRAVTSGNAQITISPAQNPDVRGQSAAPQRTVVTAGKFEAKFQQTDNGQSRITSMHGAPNARIVSVNPGQSDRISTSQSIDVAFLEASGIESITQQGNVVYNDGQDVSRRTQAWADRAHYTPADQLLALTGKPRVQSGGMVTTAQMIRMNRATGEATAENDVKSTYSELKEQPNGALLASASPIHVTAQRMASQQDPGTAVYTGNARLWQDANIIEAPSIEFDRDRRFVIAKGTQAQPVSTILVQSQKNESGEPKGATDSAAVTASLERCPDTNQNSSADCKTEVSDTANSALSGSKSIKTTARRMSKSSPININSSRLTYADTDRIAHYEGGVVAKGIDFTCSSKTMDAYLLPHKQTSPAQASDTQTSSNQSVTVISSGPGQLDHMVAQGNVTIQQPNRRALGQTLTYTAADNKFVLTGGPPSIFDAEQGKITGVSLTFYRADDRVLVEGEASTPVVTQTRVAR